MANNSSSSLSNISSPSTIHVILNIISLIATTIGTFLSFSILVGILLRKKTFRNAPLLLCTNNYILVFFLGIFEFMHNLNTFRGDFGYLVMDEETVGCRILGYILFSLISAVYLSCVLQAIFRLCRIVYPSFLWLADARTYLIIIPFMWIGSFILVSPLYIWNGQKLIPGEYICRVSKDSPFSIAYSTLVVYGLPFNSLAFTYFQVHRFLRRQTLTNNFDMTLRSQRRQRDFLVLRRIIIVVTLLGSYGMPNSVMLIILAITHELVPSFYRILELSFAALVLTLSVALFYVNPQLRKSIKICERNVEIMPAATHEFKLNKRTIVHSQQRTITRTL